MARLSAVPLKNVDHENSFQVAEQWIINEGDCLKLYFQLINAERDGIRYIPQTHIRDNDPEPPVITLPVVEVIFPAINAGSTLPAALAFPGVDGSIWFIEIEPDTEIDSGAVQFKVTERTDKFNEDSSPKDRVTHFSVENFIQVDTVVIGAT